MTDHVVKWVRGLAADPEIEAAELTLATPDGVGSYPLGLLLDTLADFLAERAQHVPEGAHPEDYCQRCQRPNPSWVVDSDRWNLALNRSEIVCPSCFVEAHEAATGLRCSWRLTPDTPFRWVADIDRPTPYVRSTGDNPSSRIPHA